MARIKLAVNEAELRQVITTLENEKSFTNRSELFDAVSKSEWGKKNKISASVVYLRVQEFDIELKTPKGKKGRSLIDGSKAGAKTSRSEKFTKNSALKKWIGSVKKVMPARFQNLVKKMEAGSMKAAIALKCVDCAYDDTPGVGLTAITKCECTDCPLWGFRTWASNVINEDSDED